MSENERVFKADKPEWVDRLWIKVDAVFEIGVWLLNFFDGGVINRGDLEIRVRESEILGAVLSKDYPIFGAEQVWSNLIMACNDFSWVFPVIFITDNLEESTFC